MDLKTQIKKSAGPRLEFRDILKKFETLTKKWRFLTILAGCIVLIYQAIISKKNNTAKTILTIFRININSSLSCKLMSSKHRLKLEAKINNKMVHSKNGLSTTLWTNWRVQVHDLPRHISPRKEQHENLKNRFILDQIFPIF